MRSWWIPRGRALRKQYEDEYEAPNEAGSGKIAAARFKAYGTSVYPDATFTLRLNYGTVQGWVENGKPVDPFTHLDLLYGRATGADPFRVPDSWLKVKDKLDMSTPFNLSTNKRHRRRQLGQRADRRERRDRRPDVRRQHPFHRRQLLVDPLLNRSVAVHPAIIRMALTQVYDVPAIAKELGL